MSIQARNTKTGRRYDVRLRDPDGRVYNRTFRTRKEAEAFEARQRADRSRGWWLDPRGADLTFEAVAKRWLAANPAKRATTRATDETMVRVHLLPVIGSRRLGSLTQPDVQALVNAWANDAAPRTVRRQYGVLRAILAYAVGADWLGRSPCRGIKLPAVTNTRRHALSPKDVARVAEAMPPDYQAMVWLGAILGMRWSEVAALRVGRVDLLRKELTVAETLTRDAEGHPVVGPPKSAAGKRTLSLSDGLVDVLAQHLAHRGLTAADPERYLFEAPEGAALRYSNWRARVWVPATMTAGCDGAGFHDLRRASATALVVGGVDIRTAQARLGHSDPRLTLGVYAQVVQEAERRAADTVGDTFLSARTRDKCAMKPSKSQTTGA
ncbi:MAG: tyrosine-type recombinase/integrase [Acidimicrobiales bacterium]